MGVGICLVDNPHSLQWSPFQDNLLAVATSNRPGHTPISGILYFLEFLPKNNIEIEHQIQLNIGTNLLAWSQFNENIVLASCDDYKLRFFDLKNIDCMYKQWYEDQKVNALDWDRISLEWILTGGSDNSVKLYNTLQDDDEAQQVIEHESNVFDAQWNTHTPFSFTCKYKIMDYYWFCLACDRDGFVYLWDMRQQKPAMKFKMHNQTCALKLDRNLYDEYSLALAGFDNGIMTYDLRNLKTPKAYIKGAHYSLITNIKVNEETTILIVSGHHIHNTC